MASEVDANCTLKPCDRQKNNFLDTYLTVWGQLCFLLARIFKPWSIFPPSWLASTSVCVYTYACESTYRWKYNISLPNPSQ